MVQALEGRGAVQYVHLSTGQGEASASCDSVAVSSSEGALESSRRGRLDFLKETSFPSPMAWPQQKQSTRENFAAGVIFVTQVPHISRPGLRGASPRG